jgi:hypothetical protein
VNVVDSSAWLEYFGDGPNASEFAPVIEDPDYLVVPTLTIFEVLSWVPCRPIHAKIQPRSRPPAPGVMGSLQTHPC